MQAQRIKEVTTATAMCVGLFVFSTLFVLVIAPLGLATSPDSLAYLEMAESLHSGHGLSQPVRTLQGLEQGAYREIAAWPPLYSAVIAAIGEIDPSGVRYLSALSLGLMASFVFLILRRFTSNLLGLLCSVLSFFTIPLLLVYSFVWSETLLLALASGALWACINYLEGSHTGNAERRFHLILLALLCSAAFYTRYLGIVCSALIAYAYFASQQQHQDRSWFLSASLIVMISAMCLLYRNFTVSGSITGTDRSVATVSGAELLEQLSYTFSAIVPSTAPAWLVCLLGALALAIGVKHLAGGPSMEVANPSPASLSDLVRCNITLRCAWLLGGGFLFAVVSLRYLTNFDDIGIRLTSPAFPAFWIIACTVLLTPDAIKKPRAATQTIAGALMLGLVWQGLLFFGHIRQNVSDLVSPVYPYHANSTHTNYTYARERGELSSLVNWILVVKPAIVASSRPSLLAFVTGMPSVRLPADFDLAFFDRLRATVSPAIASILFTRRAEYDRFLALAKGWDQPFDTEMTEDGVFIIFWPE